MQAVRWLLADVKTGQVIDELPLALNGQLERSVSRKMTTSATLPVHDRATPENWANMLGAGRSMIVPILEDADGLPAHAYLITAPEPGGPEVTLGLTSFEVVAEANYCYDHEFVGVDESRIVETLLTDSIAGEFGLTLDVTDCGRVSDQDYYWTEDRLVASAISDLAGKVGGPEWTTRIRWADAAQTRFEKVVEIGPQIGRRIESVVFENAHVARDGRRRGRDWTPGRGFATVVQAVGDGSGESRPMSALLADDALLAAGTPQWVQRVPAPTLEEQNDLDAFAASQLRLMRYGRQSWDLTLNVNEPGCPMPVVDFDAGDTVTMSLDPTDDDTASWYGPARVIGWRMGADGNELTTFTPVFWDPSELEVG